MEVEFDDGDLDRLETDIQFSAGFDRAVVKGFRKVMQVIRSAPDERDFYAMKSLHFEKLEGSRSHQRSMRLTIKWRLILELDGNAPNKIVKVKGIEDYHD
jgi:proteic killer suppression protein